MFVCLKCREEKPAYDMVCSCGGGFTIVDIPPASWKPIGKDSVPVTPKDIRAQKIDARVVPGFGFLGQLPDCFSMLLYGKPGGGKSTFALRFADVLARRRKTAYIAAEEGVRSATMKKKLDDEDIKALDLILEANNCQDVLDIIEHIEPTNVIIDSISVLNIKPRQLKRIKDKVKGVFIAIAQSTKQKGGWSYRGRGEIAHLVDVVAYAEAKVIGEFARGIVVTEKNRLEIAGKAYKVFERRLTDEDIGSSIDDGVRGTPDIQKQNKGKRRKKGRKAHHFYDCVQG